MESRDVTGLGAVEKFFEKKLKVWLDRDEALLVEVFRA